MSGTVKLTWRGQAVSKELRAELGRAIADAAENLLENANRAVPIETGTLARSGTVTAAGLEAAVSYDTPYAVYQHEVAGLRHDEGRTDHWLKNTLDRNRSRYQRFIAERLKGNMGRGLRRNG